MTLDGTGLRVLTEAECYERLATATIGRIALSWRALPLILPVRFELLGRTVVVLAGADTTLAHATDRTVVAFEAEGPAGAVEPVWSVAARGLATHHGPSVGAALVQVRIAVHDATGREIVSR